MKTPAKDYSLLILMLIMLVNALSYGTIIPLLYPYASKFGIGPFGLSMLFASFSLAQFVATPIIGRLADIYGRKPLLLISLFGTSLSLLFFALAQTVPQLFLARILDGITGGNMSVAQAVIADRTKGEDRAKYFGLLGASFGFGFLIGPALGGILSQINIIAPFLFASALALIGTFAGVFFLKESLPKNKQISQQPLIPAKALLTSLFVPVTGIVFGLSLLSSIAHNAWIIGFQSFTVDELRLSAFQIGLLFSAAGLMNILMQGFGIKILLQTIGSKKKILALGLFGSAVIIALSVPVTNFILFGFIMLIYMLFISPQNVMVTAILSERTKAEDQGAILGLNQSYFSLGQIVGPLLAGAVATIHISWVFMMASGIFAIATIGSKWLFVPVREKTDI